MDSVNKSIERSRNRRRAARLARSRDKWRQRFEFLCVKQVGLREWERRLRRQEADFQRQVADFQRFTPAYKPWPDATPVECAQAAAQHLAEAFRLAGVSTAAELFDVLRDRVSRDKAAL